MVFPIIHRRPCLRQQWYNQKQSQLRCKLKLQPACVREAFKERRFATKRRLETPAQSLTSCGPRKDAGRFKRILTGSSLPLGQSANDTDVLNLSSHTKANPSTLRWAALLLATLACCILPRLLGSPRQQQQCTTGQAAVTVASETPQASSFIQQPSGAPGQQHTFASISSASFASLFSGAQRARLAQILVYQAQRLLTMNILTKLMALVILGTPFIVVGGLLYKQASGSTWREALFKSYAVLQNVPGADATVEPNYKSALVINTIFQLGLLTFAVVLGVVCNDISAAVESVQSGNYAVVESGHTVILNWNKLTIPILRQMAVAKAEHQQGTFKGPVVVLADRDKAEMDAAVADGLQGPVNLEVLTRSGRPQSIGDLEKAAVGRAKVVVMLHPDGEESAAEQKVAAITGIETLGGGAKAGQNLLIQSGPESEEGDALLAIATRAAIPKHMNLGLVQMKDQERMDRLTAQCAVQPGLGKVYSQILLQSRTSAEFYLKDIFPSLVGQSFAQARRSFDEAVLCGIMDTSTRQAQLNPADECILDDHHCLVFLSSTARIQPSKQAEFKASTSNAAPTAVASGHIPTQESHEVQQGKHIVVIGWNMDQTVEGLVKGLGDFAPADSSITIISPEKPDDIPEECGTCQCQHLEGSVASRQVLLEAGVAEADAVILRMPLQALADNDADAQVVSSLVQLQDLATQSGRTKPLHVIAPVRHPRTIELINYITMHSHSTAATSQDIGAVKTVTGDHQHHMGSQEGAQTGFLDGASGRGRRKAHRANAQGGVGQKVVLNVDVLLPDELLSGLLTQVSVQPELLSVMNDLFDHEGAEMYLRDVSSYGLAQDASTQVTFQQVAEAARQQKETALGYLLQDGTVITAPNAGQKRVLHTGDRIIALADQA